MTVEICCGDFESLVAAAEGGTRRIELCSGLSEGGLTPSAGMIRAAADLGIESVNVLVRPRKGDFCYNSREVDLMCREISIAAAEGATGIVAGALTPDGDIDIDTTGRLRQAAGDLQFTFHRAFDLCNDPLKALEDLVALQCDTLLTSGQAQSAPLGTQLIARLVDVADGRITVMAGAGVNSANVARLIALTGVKAVHSTARGPVPSLMRFRRPGVSMGAPGDDEYQRMATSASEVAAIIAAAGTR